MSAMKDSDVELVSRSKFFTTDEYDEAVAKIDSHADESAAVLIKIIQTVCKDEAEITQWSKMKEAAIYHLGKIYAKSGDESKVQQLMVDIRPFFAEISKPRSAKIVRTLIDEIATMPNSDSFLVTLCLDSIAWCTQEKRSFLRQRLEARLAGLYCNMKKYKESLAIIKKLVREIKKFDDKPLMVEIELVESDVYLALQNIPKSKGALTAARSNANGFYCPPLVQAQIDMQGGVLCGREKDFKTAFSYFYEAYEGFSSSNKDAEAIRALKYMLLSKIMSDQSSDVYNIINSKAGIRYAGIQVQSMKAIAEAYKQRSLQAFERVLDQYAEQLKGDKIVHAHLNSLYDKLLEQNLLRLVEPYSHIQIDRIAHLIGLPREVVESKLSQMILDSSLNGILDQGSGDLVMFETAPEDPVYKNAQMLLKELDSVVDKLAVKSQKLTFSS